MSTVSLEVLPQNDLEFIKLCDEATHVDVQTWGDRHSPKRPFSQLLPGVLCEATTIAYLLLRVSDYLEDNEEMNTNQKVGLLNLWVNILRDEADIETLTSQFTQANTDNPDAIVAQHSKEIQQQLRSLPYAVQEIIVRHVIHSTQGMARWTQIGPNVAHQNEMDDYMFEVAGRVGYLVTQLFAWYSFTIRRKENEITKAPQVLKLVEISQKVITGDAMHTQRGLATQILEAQGDYVLPVKETQPQLYKNIQSLFAPDYPKPGFGKIQTDFLTAQKVNKGHGRIETRTITTSKCSTIFFTCPQLFAPPWLR